MSSVKDEAWGILNRDYGKIIISIYDNSDPITLSQLMTLILAELRQRVEQTRLQLLEEIENEIVEDGFGTSAPAVCSICGCRAVYVCRPGDIRCGVCYDGNPKEWYTGSECLGCGMQAIHNGICLCCNEFKKENETKTTPDK